MRSAIRSISGKRNVTRLGFLSPKTVEEKWVLAVSVMRVVGMEGEILDHQYVLSSAERHNLNQ